VSEWQTILLGFVAGATILIGLPLGRARRLRPSFRTFLNAASAGVLLFLLFDILQNATEPLEAAVGGVHTGTGSVGTLTGLGLLYVLGLGTGLVGLLYVAKYQRTRRGARHSSGPGAMAISEATPDTGAALQLGMSIATGIGLHNFSEGLAIGQAATGGQLSLALLLVIGFALHNATEGFGIVGPLAAGGVRASWGYLLAAGAVAGGPTLVGTLVGTAFSSEYVFVLFLALAAGAIIYVVAELLNMGRKLSWEITIWGVLAGFVAGLATEMVLVAAGA
jgi:zinc transporter, ZIP family